jgi:hypothetical protein
MHAKTCFVLPLEPILATKVIATEQQAHANLMIATIAVARIDVACEIWGHKFGAVDGKVARIRRHFLSFIFKTTAFFKICITCSDNTLAARSWSTCKDNSFYSKP